MKWPGDNVCPRDGSVWINREDKKMKKRTRLMAVVGLSLALVSTATPPAKGDDFPLECLTLGLTEGEMYFKPRTEFTACEEVLMVLGVGVEEGALYERKVKVKVKAKLTSVEWGLSVSLDNPKVEMADAGILYDIEGAQTIEDEIDSYGEITRIITVPSELPDADGAFGVEVAIEELGMSRCDFKIQIRS